MIYLLIGEIEEGRNSLLCVVCDGEGKVLEYRPLTEMFLEFILDLRTTSNEGEFNQFAEHIKKDQQTNIDFIERLQLPMRNNVVH